MSSPKPAYGKDPQFVVLPTEMKKRVQHAAVEIGCKPSHVIEECIRLSFDDVVKLPSVSGHVNKAFAGSN